MKALLVSVALFLACSLSSCAYCGGAPVYGLSPLVSCDDLRAATIAVRKINYVGKIYAYRVNSAEDIQIYISPDLDGSYWAARKVNGKWEQNGGQLVLKEPVGY